MGVATRIATESYVDGGAATRLATRFYANPTIGEPEILATEKWVDDNPAGGPAAYVAAVLADNPWLVWGMQDAGAPIQDLTANDRDGEGVQGTPDYQQAGPMGDFGIHFTASEFISLATGGSSPNITDNFTLETFYYRITAAQTAYIWQAGLPSGGGWSIFQNANGKFAGLANNVALLADSANVAPLNTWCHIVVVRDAGVWKYYFNGAVDNANAGNSAPAAPSDLNAIAGPAFTNVEMRLAYTAIYDSVLSAARVAAHWAATGL